MYECGDPVAHHGQVIGACTALGAQRRCPFGFKAIATDATCSPHRFQSGMRTLGIARFHCWRLPLKNCPDPKLCENGGLACALTSITCVLGMLRLQPHLWLWAGAAAVVHGKSRALPATQRGRQRTIDALVLPSCWPLPLRVHHHVILSIRCCQCPLTIWPCISEIVPDCLGCTMIKTRMACPGHAEEYKLYIIYI